MAAHCLLAGFRQRIRNPEVGLRSKSSIFDEGVMRTIDLNGQRDVYICIDLGLEVYQQGPVGTNQIRASNIPANRQNPGIIQLLFRGDEPSQVASDGVGHWPTGRPSRRTNLVPGYL